MRVIGSQGKRAVLRNLTRLEIERFREQVTVINHIGCSDLAAIQNAVEEFATQNLGPLSAPFQPPQVPCIQPTIPDKLRLDEAGLGSELAKAELSLHLHFPYRQDAALGELDPETAVEW